MRFQKKSSATPHNGEVVGSKSLVPLWRSATAWPTPGWLGGLWGGLLDSGDFAGWLSDPLRPSTSSIRAASLPAGVLASAHQGSRLNPGTSDPSSEGSSRTSLSVSGLLQVSSSSRRLRGRGTPSLTSHPEQLSPRLLLHGDSIVSPSFHSPRRLDGLSGTAGRLPAGSYSSRFTSLSSLRGRRKDVPVQGPLLRSHNRAQSLHEDYGSHFRHPPQVWMIDSS